MQGLAEKFWIVAHVPALFQSASRYGPQKLYGLMSGNLIVISFMLVDPPESLEHPRRIVPNLSVVVGLPRVLLSCRPKPEQLDLDCSLKDLSICDQPILIGLPFRRRLDFQFGCTLLCCPRAFPRAISKLECQRSEVDQYQRH